MASRTADLLTVEFAKANDIAITASKVGGQFADAFLGAFYSTDSWSGEELKRLPYPLLTQILSRHPQFFCDPEIWRRDDAISVAGKFLPQFHADGELAHKVIGAMVKSESWSAILTMIDNLGGALLENLFAAIDESDLSSFTAPDQFFDEVADGRRVWTSLLDRNSLGAKSTAILASCLDPRSYYVRDRSLEKWSKSIEIPPEFLPAKRVLRTKVFLLSLALSSGNPLGANVTAAVFQVVFDCAARDQLDGNIWDELEPVMLWHNPNWDKCVRLVRSAAQAFKEHNWDVGFFFKTFTTAETLQRALSEIDHGYRGKRFVNGARHLVATGEIGLTGEQAEVMRNWK